MITLHQAKQWFFDRAGVLAALDRPMKKILSRFGAFVRRRAQTSMRVRRRSSPPGQPPSAHTRLLRDHIYFGFDPAARSVVIGPVRLGRLPGTAPAALETGGYSRDHNGRRVYIRARPYMQPALRRELPQLPPLWRNVIRRTGG